MEELVLKRLSRSQLRTLAPLLLILVLGMASIGGFLNYFTLALEEASRDDLRNRVAIALELEGDQIAVFSTQYSYWDEAYRKLVTRPDRGFANDHIGGYMTKYMDVDISLVVNRGSRVVFAYRDGKPADVNFNALKAAGLTEIFAMDRSLKDPAKGEHGLLGFDDKVYLVGVNAFDDQFSSDGQKVSFLVLARELDARYLDELAIKYQIPGLRFDTRGNAVADLKLPVWGITGEQLSALTWQDPALARPIGRQLAPFAAATTIAMCLLTLFLVRSELARHHEHSKSLSRIAYRDELTGIDNRRAFMESGRRELVRSDRSGRPVLLMMLDVDHFKSINDKHGHATGDEVLVQLAECLRRELREYDLVARIGGEEFAVMIAEMSLEQGKFTAERLRKAIEKLHSLVGERIPAITASIGLAEYKSGAEDLDGLMSRADRALYKAKHSGRNRCVAVNGRVSPASLKRAAG